MRSFHQMSRRGWFRWGFGLCFGLLWLCLPQKTYALCGLDAAAFDQIRHVQDYGAPRAWFRHLSGQQGTCAVCHLAGYGPRNQYGSAINLLLTGKDREDSARKREAGRRVNDIPANPSLPDSPTFGDLIKQGLLPASDFTIDPIFRKVPTKPQETITVQRARELVQKSRSESRFGILQLSRTYTITPQVAEALAEFQGEVLILGLTTLEPETAKALAKSRAGTVWLHSVTRMTNESADAIVKLQGDLVLSGLVELTSASLAQKLAQRPSALSFPYLKQITPQTAVALGKNAQSLNLAALADVSPEVQNKLAEAVGALTMPKLKSLDSLSLTKKLAMGFASSVLLPSVKSLSVEQANQIASIKRPFFLGGIYLPPSVMTEEIATVFANNPGAGRLELGAGLISNDCLQILIPSQLSIVLREVESLSEEQVRILANAPDFVTGGPFGTQKKLSLPKLKTLDSALLAKTLLRCSSDFGSVTRISRDAAAELVNLPNREEVIPNGMVQTPRPYSLSFPNLEKLEPQTARLLMTRPWASISLPSLQEVSPETVRSLVRQTSHMSLGITKLTPELASAFGEMASNTFDLGGGTLTLPFLVELSPDAAQNLVKSLNRGTEVSVWGGLNKSPQLFIGGRGRYGRCPPLTPDLAAKLASYRGRLSISGLRELSPQSAAALASYRGPSLDLSGPATDQLLPETAAALAKLPGKLDIPLRVLDSVPLAEKFSRNQSVTLNGLEVISAEVIPPYVKSKGFFTQRQLLALDSPVLAARLIQDSSGQVLPSLRTLTPAAANVLATSSHAIHLGLIVLDDPAVARALAGAPKGTNLLRLRAATPKVIAILRDANSIKTPPLDSIFVLPENQLD